MEKNDRHGTAIGVFIALFGATCCTVGTLLAFRFETFRQWWAVLIETTARAFASPEAMLDAQATVFGLFLGVGGLMLFLVGVIIAGQAIGEAKRAPVEERAGARSAVPSGS